MHIGSFLFGTMAVSGALAKGRRCGFKGPTEAQRAVHRKFAEQEAAARISDNMTMSIQSPVNVYFHVVASSTAERDGYLSVSATGGLLTHWGQTLFLAASTLAGQLDVMNERYGVYGLSFNQAGADWTVNSEWARDEDEYTMKYHLHQGTYQDLNIYFLPELDGLLGYAYLPDDLNRDPDLLVWDGVTVLSGSVPGGDAVPFDLGITAVHEIGHWLGLLHTSADGCSSPGDYISDTPAEATEAYGCPVGRDTCPGGGFDPIHNYMDYTDDSCLEEFSNGQIERINSYWSAYRA